MDRKFLYHPTAEYLFFVKNSFSARINLKSHSAIGQRFVYLASVLLSDDVVIFEFLKGSIYNSEL